MGIFYDGTKLLSLLDLDKKRPEIYICTTNRSAGKTTYFSRLLVNRFFKFNEKFCLIYRFKYELDDVANQFYKDIAKLFFPGTTMLARKRSKGIYYELFINNIPCGYAIALNSAEQIKKYSHLLSDTSSMFFDEFQSETNHYCDDEITKFISIHTSIARGNGEQARYLPVYMCSNTVTMLNPYYIELGISERLKSNTIFLRGNGFVLEQGFVKTASKALLETGFSRAFSKNSYTNYSTQQVYLNDSSAFIEKPKGNGKYLATIKYKGGCYAIREYSDSGIIYCDDHPDLTFPFKLSLTTQDHNINFVMLKRNSVFFNNLRYFFDKGCFRFKNLLCKEVVLKTLSY